MRDYKVIAGLFLSLLFICIVGCSDKGNKSGDSNSGELPKDSIVIAVTGADSSSVFELTQENHKVIYESSRFGVFVKAIDGHHMGNDHFWIYTVNDTARNVASDRYLTNNGDKIEWHLRRAIQ